jgi:hypothetical protein
VEYLKELAQRAELGSWNAWGMQYRLLAVVVGLLVAYFALRAILPAVLRLARWVIFLALVVFGVWVLFPAETCSIEILSRLPILCVR